MKLTKDEKIEVLEKVLRNLWTVYRFNVKVLELNEDEDSSEEDLTELIENPFFTLEIEKGANNEKNNKEICEKVEYIHSLIKHPMEIDELTYLLQIDHNTIFNALKDKGYDLKKIE